jgi:aspartate aminotransferase-like enzyme
MIKKERLFTPGPTALLPQAQAAAASMAMHHRTAEFRALLRDTLDRLKAFVQTRNDVILLASSGTGAMEAAVANTATPGDRVLVLTAGKFGERWEKLAATFGCVPDVVKLPYGSSFRGAAVRERLVASGSGSHRAVLLQATESSTGVRHDVESIARAVRDAGSDALIVVDAITGIGTSPLDVDGWDLDFVIGGSQKAVMLPPGLAYLSVSERAWKRMAEAKAPRFYFDLQRERKSQASGETAFTPATSLVAALHAALVYIESIGGRPGLTANAEALASATRAAAAALGLKRFGDGIPAGALTAIESPAGVESGAIVKSLREQFASIVANGQGEMKGRLFRVAHLGYYDFAETLSLIGQLEIVLYQLGRLEKSALGSGVAAAQLDWLDRPAAAGQAA